MLFEDVKPAEVADVASRVEVLERSVFEVRSLLMRTIHALEIERDLGLEKPAEVKAENPGISEAVAERIAKGEMEFTVPVKGIPVKVSLKPGS